MSDFQNEMNRTVQAFVTQISELARRAALDTLESAFTGRLPSAKTSGSPAVIATTGAGSTSRVRSGRGAKRSTEDLEAMSQQFAAFVRANPGLRVEQINKELGTTTKDLALPIRKLLAEGFVTSKGSKRSTTYYPGRKYKN
jgi:hypothetical protein